eukprot:3993007-Prymnesium_polylepis.1
MDGRRRSAPLCEWGPGETSAMPRLRQNWRSANQRTICRWRHSVHTFRTTRSEALCELALGER